jgi:hypothetical protein
VNDFSIVFKVSVLSKEGEQPVGGVTGCRKMKKVIFLLLRIQKKYEEITKET